jgi:hypothetical protein
MPPLSLPPRFRGLLTVPFLAVMLAFSAGALAEPTTAPTGQAPSPADIKPGSLELDPNAPVRYRFEHAWHWHRIASTGTGNARAPESPRRHRFEHAKHWPGSSGPITVQRRLAWPPRRAPTPRRPAPRRARRARAMLPRRHGQRLQDSVNIDKSTQEMTVFVDGIERHSWPALRARAAIPRRPATTRRGR